MPMLLTYSMRIPSSSILIHEHLNADFLVLNLIPNIHFITLLLVFPEEKQNFYILAQNVLI